MLDLEEISQQALERYSKRYREMGYSVKTLGWGTVEQQVHRFQQTLYATSFSSKRILDIGCGFGDYFEFLRSQEIATKSYSGWDLNPSFIHEARSKVGISNNVRVADISCKQDLLNYSKCADIVVMLGLLNYNLKNELDNYSYSEKIIRNAFSLTKEVLIVDFLSACRTPEYSPEDFVFYHWPQKMLEFSLKLSPKVVLKHDYAPIPQKEFMLFIYRTDENF